MSGTYPNPVVAKIQGLSISSATPSIEQVLKWNGSQWAPGTDNSGTGGDNWGTQTVQSDVTLSGEGTSGSPLLISQQGAITGQVLEWNGSAWAPATDDTGTGGGDDWGTQTVQTDATLFGDGTSVSPLTIDQQGATTGQVLEWNGSAWAPGTDDIGGGGVAGGDLSGTYPNPTIASNAITSNKIADGSITTADLSFSPLTNPFAGDFNVTGGTIEVYPATDGTRGLRLRSADQSENFILDMKNDGTMQIGANSGVMQLASTFGVYSQNLSGTWRPMYASSFNVQSSRSLKTNIKYIEKSDTFFWLEQISLMKPAIYNYNWEAESTQPRLGFIVEELPNELKGQDGKSVNLYALTSAGIVAIKGLYLMLEKQQELIKSLQEEIKALKNEGGQP